MICSRREVRALSIGPAASVALSAGAATLRVHSVFPSTVNLEVEGARRFVSFCGPRGRAFPHAIAVERPEDFTTWRLAAGSPARLTDGSIRFVVEPGAVAVDLEQAERLPARTLPPISRLAGAHRACRSGWRNSRTTRGAS